MDKDQIEQRWDGTMGQTAISCTDRKLPGSLPELRLTVLGSKALAADCAVGVCKGRHGEIARAEAVHALVLAVV
jgi:hypothetical protein